MWTCTIRWLRTRREPLPAGQFTYCRRGKVLVIGFTVFMAAESLITHGVLLAIFGPALWTWVLLAFGLYSAAWIFGRYYACMVVRPHAVTADAVLLYCGNIGELIIPREAVLSARRTRHGQIGGLGKLVVEKSKPAAEARFSNGSCTVAIELDPGAPLTFNGKPVTTPISTLYINADDPDGLIAALSEAR